MPERDDRAATVEAVREALADMRAGDVGVPASEAIAELRRKHGLTEPPRPLSKREW